MNQQFSTADAFYKIFLTLPQNERLIAAKYILTNTEVQKVFDLTEIINQTTLDAFAEDKGNMPAFSTIDDLRKELLS